MRLQGEGCCFEVVFIGGFHVFEDEFVLVVGEVGHVPVIRISE